MATLGPDALGVCSARGHRSKPLSYSRPIGPAFGGLPEAGPMGLVSQETSVFSAESRAAPLVAPTNGAPPVSMRPSSTARRTPASRANFGRRTTTATANRIHTAAAIGSHLPAPVG